MLSRLGRWCFHKRRAVLGLWIVGVAGLFGAALGIGGGFTAEQQLPGSETEAGFDALDEHFGAFGGAGSGLTGTIVFSAEQGVDDPEVVSVMQQMFSEASAIDGVQILSPYESGGFSGGGISDSGEIAYTDIQLGSEVDQEIAGGIGDEIGELIPALAGLQVEIGGAVLSGVEPPQSELIGVAFAIFILILATGSVLGMGLPLAVALFGVGGGLTATVLASNLSGGPEFATTIATMIGLGVGIDYTLFLVTRYRELLREGADPAEAAAGAMNTAGRAVLFAGITVVVSLLGLIAIGLPFVTGIGVATSVTVLVTLVSSLTLMPALVGFAGDRLEVTRRRGIIAASLVAVALFGVGFGISPLVFCIPVAIVVLIAGFFVPALRKPLNKREVKPLRETMAYRWSRFVQARPRTIAVAGTAILLLISAPLLDIRLGFSDESNFSEETTTRRAYDLLADGFGPGFNGPFLITAVINSDQDAEAIGGLVSAIRADPGIAAVPPELPNAVSPDAFLIRAIPHTAPQDQATEHLVKRLRNEVIPQAIEGTTLAVALTGETAAGIDFSDYLSGRIPVFFTAVLVFSFILLMAVFRSLLVPIKAVIMNLLSIGAAYGIVVAAFQWGWLSDITGADPGPIEPFIPMMMFAIVFGLSMDYEVFLLSRIREEYQRTGDPVTSVSDGLAATARVITAAAAIMAFVFGSFMLEDLRVAAVFGLGLASAIVVDATLVRLLLVPATMELLGAKNWWMPAWLDRIVPRLEIDSQLTSRGSAT